MGDDERRGLKISPFPAYKRRVTSAAKAAAEAKDAKNAKGAQRRPPAPDALPEFDVHSRPAGASPAGDPDEGEVQRDVSDAIAGVMRTALSRTRAGDEEDGADGAAALMDLFRDHAGVETTDWTSIGGAAPAAVDLAARARVAASVSSRRAAQENNPLALLTGRTWRAVGLKRVVLALYICALLDDETLRLAVFGCGGAGKSFCIGIVTDLGRLWRKQREAVANMAQTPSAGRAISDGCTDQSFHPQCQPKFPKVGRKTPLAALRCSTIGLDDLRVKLRVSGTRGEVRGWSPSRVVRVRARECDSRLASFALLVSRRSRLASASLSSQCDALHPLPRTR